jgi:choloylglycine hydrolase
MKCIVLFLFGYFLFSCLSPDEGSTCTTFVLGEKDNQVFGRNYDWDVEDGLVIINKRGVLKRGYPRDEEKGTPAVWTSKYGSVTFNQYGRELPTGGMNEAGLVVETMALSEARYPRPDKRPYLGSALQWRQFLLDNFALVNEVIASDTMIRISPRRKGLGVHVLISDRIGNCASVEFLDGKMIAHTGPSLPVRVLTNDTYANSVYYWNKGKTPLVDPGRSFWRFIRAAQMIEDYDAQKEDVPFSYAFKILNAVSARRTVWSIVYDNIKMKIHFRTRMNSKMRAIDVTRLDYACQTPVQIIDINAQLSGDITDHFENYTRQKNRALVENSFRKTSFLRNTPKAALDRLSEFPETMKCKP